MKHARARTAAALVLCTCALLTRAEQIEKLTLSLTVKKIVEAKEALGHADCVVAPQSKELLAVDNHGRKTIDVFDLDGRFKRTMPTQGFPDMEGLVHMQGSQFAAVDEKLRTITTLTIMPWTRKVAKRSGRTYKLNLPEAANNGLEGITYNAAQRCFYVVNEGPLAVYKVVLVGRSAKVSELFDAESMLGRKCKDLLDVVYEPKSRHLFFLSDKSEAIFETDLQGNILSVHPIPAGLPEGIAFSTDRSKLYLIDQKGILYRYDVTWRADDVPSR